MAHNHGTWKPENSPFYFCRFKVGGEPFYSCTNETTRAGAVAFAKDWKKRELRKHRESGVKTGARMTFLAAADRYVRELDEGVIGLAQIEARLDWLVDRIGAGTRLADIDNDLLAKVVSDRKSMFRFGCASKGKVKGSTVTQDVLVTLSALMRRAKKAWGVPMPNFPDFGMHRHKTEYRTREISIREELELEREAGDYWDILQFALLSGLRRSELTIRWNNVVWEEDRIRVKVKGGKTHEVLITPGIRRILTANKGRHPVFVFTLRDEGRSTGCDLPPRAPGPGRPIKPEQLYSAFVRMRLRAGIKDLTIHDLRRTAGARKYRATGRICLVSTFLGHSSVEMTRRYYVHIKMDDVKAGIVESEAAYDAMRDEMIRTLAA